MCKLGLILSHCTRLDLQSKQDENAGVKENENVYQGLLDRVVDKAQHTPFMVAVMKGFFEIAELLLEDDMSDVNL